MGYWGDLLTAGAMKQGIAGLVIDGCIRDADEIETWGFPVFSRGFCIKGTGKDPEGSLDEPITIGGVTAICTAHARRRRVDTGVRSSRQSVGSNQRFAFYMKGRPAPAGQVVRQRASKAFSKEVRELPQYNFSSMQNAYDRLHAFMITIPAIGAIAKSTNYLDDIEYFDQKGKYQQITNAIVW